MKTLLLILALSLGVCRVSQAAPAALFESTLRRAETVLLARVVSIRPGSVTLQRVEVLRGNVPAEITLSIEDYAVWAFDLRVGADFLVLSQGDARNGPPRPVLGTPGTKGQMVWCGWLPYPIRTKGEDRFIEGVYSKTEGIEGEGKLGIASIRRLVERFAYDPQVYKNDGP